MASIDKIVGAFTLCSTTGCYLKPGFNITKIAPNEKDEIEVISSLIGDVNKTVVDQSSVVGTGEKCAKLAKLIPAYCSRFKAVVADTKLQQKISSLVSRLGFIDKSDNLALKRIESDEEMRKIELNVLREDPKNAHNYHICHYPGALLKELTMLNSMKKFVSEFKEISLLLKDWKGQLDKESIYTTSTGKILVFPSIKTESTLEVSLRLKAIAEIKKIMELNVRVTRKEEFRFATKIQDEILSYKYSRPERASFCDDLLKFMAINAKLINYQLTVSEAIIKTWHDAPEYSRFCYIFSIFDLSIKEFLLSITDMVINGNLEDWEYLWKMCFEKYTSIKAEFTSEKAEKDDELVCKEYVNYLSDVKKGIRFLPPDLPRKFRDKLESGPITDLRKVYFDLISELKSPEDSMPIMGGLYNKMKDRSVHTPAKDENASASFLPQLVNKQPAAPKKKKRAKKKISTAVDAVVKTTISATDIPLKELTGKVEKLKISSKPSTSESKDVIKTTAAVDFRRLFPAPKMHFHDRVLRWKRDDAMRIFDSDPAYSGKGFSERVKKRIIFEHGFADAVAAVAMKEGNVTTNKADEKKYGAVKRVQVVGEAVFDGTEERVQGVFSFSQGKNGLWFHVGFTPQESEASCKNYLKTGLYCVEYPVLTKDSTEVVAPKNATAVLTDGSFIKSVSENVVTIRDPAHGATIYLARMK